MVTLYQLQIGTLVFATVISVVLGQGRLSDFVDVPERSYIKGPLGYAFESHRVLAPVRPFVNPQDQVFANAVNEVFKQSHPQLKRSQSHRVQARAVNQFKNCYFSPVQCVLLERRRRR